MTQNQKSPSKGFSKEEKIPARLTLITTANTPLKSIPDNNNPDPKSSQKQNQNQEFFFSKLIGWRQRKFPIFFLFFFLFFCFSRARSEKLQFSQRTKGHPESPVDFSMYLMVNYKSKRNGYLSNKPKIIQKPLFPLLYERIYQTKTKWSCTLKMTILPSFKISSCILLKHEWRKKNCN